MPRVLRASLLLTVLGLAVFGFAMVAFPKWRKQIFAAMVVSPVPPIP